jgi:hypothetical protein
MHMATLANHLSFVDAVAAEMTSVVERAVDCWMAEVEQALGDPHLTTLGRLAAVRDILERYKTFTGRTTLEGRNGTGEDQHWS